MVNIILAISILWLFSTLFVITDDTIDNCIYWIKGKLNKDKKREISVIRDIDKYLENTWLRDKYLYIYRFFNSIKEFPNNFYYETKYFIQRGRRGYSKRDTWGFYNYLTNIMVDGLKDLQKMVHGSPSGFVGSHSIDLEEESEGTKEWKRIIGEIIWVFEAIKKVNNHDWILVPDEAEREELRKFVKRLNRPHKPLFRDSPPHKWHLMTKAEMKRYNKGWDYLKQYFMELWD